MQAVEFSSRWNLMPIRALVTYYAVSNVDKALQVGETPVRLCNYSDVYNNEFISPHMNLMQATASDNEIERFSLSENDVIITKDSESWEDIGVPALVIESSTDLVCGYHLALLRPNRKMILGAFLLRCLQARPVQMQLELAATGITRFGIPKSAIGSTLVPVPPIGEQRAITDYLDRETARLDTLVAETSGLLDLLSEKRSALIASMIAGYPTQRLKYVVSLRRSRIDRSEDDSLYVGLENIEPRTGKLLSKLPASTSPLTNTFERDDVLFGKLRPYLAKAWVAEFRGRCSSELLVMKPVRIHPGFLRYVCLWSEFVDTVDASTFGSKMPRADWDFIGNVAVPVPERSEQRAVCEYLDRETARLDSLVAETSSLLDLLSEKRSALIAAVITGKKTVGNAT